MAILSSLTSRLLEYVSYLAKAMVEAGVEAGRPFEVLKTVRECLSEIKRIGDFLPAIRDEAVQSIQLYSARQSERRDRFCTNDVAFLKRWSCVDPASYILFSQEAFAVGLAFFHSSICLSSSSRLP